MGRSGGSLVTSLYRRRGIECSRSFERTRRRPIKRTFDGRGNDCLWKLTRDPARRHVFLEEHKRDPARRHAFLEEHKVADH